MENLDCYLPSQGDPQLCTHAVEALQNALLPAHLDQTELLILRQSLYTPKWYTNQGTNLPVLHRKLLHI